MVEGTCVDRLEHLKSHDCLCLNLTSLEDLKRGQFDLDSSRYLLQGASIPGDQIGVCVAADEIIGRFEGHCWSLDLFYLLLESVSGVEATDREIVGGKLEASVDFLVHRDVEIVLRRVGFDGFEDFVVSDPTFFLVEHFHDQVCIGIFTGKGKYSENRGAVVRAS